MSKSLKEMQDEVYAINRANGWYDDDVTFGERIALLHSEVSEALEEWRVRGFGRYYKVDDKLFEASDPLVGEWKKENTSLKPISVQSEIADVFIRLLDFCYCYGIDLEAEYEEKLAYNATRDYRHGGRKI